MVQITENWSEISGKVLGISPSVLEGFAAIRVQIEDITAVDGFPNLLHEAKGSEVEVLARPSFTEAAGIRVGGAISCRVRRAGINRIFIHDEHCRML